MVSFVMSRTQDNLNLWVAGLIQWMLLISTEQIASLVPFKRFCRAGTRFSYEKNGSSWNY